MIINAQYLKLIQEVVFAAWMIRFLIGYCIVVPIAFEAFSPFQAHTVTCIFQNLMQVMITLTNAYLIIHVKLNLVVMFI